MSTRGMIATVRDDRLVGVYQHFDSYPSGLATRLLGQFTALGGDLERMRREAIDDHLGGWSSYPGRCYCHGASKPEFAPLIECRCAAGDVSGCDPLFLEWVYVLNARGLDVYTHVRAGGTHDVPAYNGSTFASPNYRHEFVGTLPWDADEDAVMAIEYRGGEIAEAAYEEHGTGVTVL